MGDQRGVGIKDFIPHAPLELVHLINQTLIYDVERRIRSRQAFEHKYFDPIRIDDDCISTTSIRKTLSVGSSKSMGIKKTLSVGSSKSTNMSIKRTPSVESYNSRGVKKNVSGESRNEQTSRRNHGLKNDAPGVSNKYTKKRIIIEGQIEKRQLVKAKPKPKSKVNNKSTSKTQRKTEYKSTNSKKVQPDEYQDKKKSRFRSKLKFNRTRHNDETKQNKTNYNGRLPTINNSCLPGSNSNNNNTKSKVAAKSSSKIKEVEGKETSKTVSEATRQSVRKSINKYSNVASSGYGRSSYKPSKPKHPKPSPSSSTVTDRTAQTSSQISSLSSLPYNDQVGERKKKRSPTSQHRKKVPMREDTISKLPAVQ